MPHSWGIAVACMVRHSSVRRLSRSSMRVCKPREQASWSQTACRATRLGRRRPWGMRRAPSKPAPDRRGARSPTERTREGGAMSRAIADLSEMDPSLRLKLENAGIRTTDELLARGATPAQRSELAQRLGVDGQRLSEWVNLADLIRLQGVDVPTASLLNVAGIHSCQELREWNPELLLSRLILV